MKIQQELGVLTADRITEEAIEQCAIEEGLKMIEQITSRCKSSKNSLFIKYVNYYFFFFYIT